MDFTTNVKENFTGTIREDFSNNLASVIFINLRTLLIGAFLVNFVTGLLLPDYKTAFTKIYIAIYVVFFLLSLLN